MLHADILYLNNQRLVAIEELNKTNKENQLLLNKIKKLEVEKQADAGKGNQLHHIICFSTSYKYNIFGQLYYYRLVHVSSL